LVGNIPYRRIGSQNWDENPLVLKPAKNDDTPGAATAIAISVSGGTGGVGTPLAIVGLGLAEYILWVQRKDYDEKETGQQYEEISRRQRELRKRGQGERIKSIKGSKQCDREDLQKLGQDTLEKLRKQRIDRGEV
jgi:hypothetical protein